MSHGMDCIHKSLAYWAPYSHPSAASPSASSPEKSNVFQVVKAAWRELTVFFRWWVLKGSDIEVFFFTKSVVTVIMLFYLLVSGIDCKELTSVCWTFFLLKFKCCSVAMFWWHAIWEGLLVFVGKMSDSVRETFFSCWTVFGLYSYIICAALKTVVTFHHTGWLIRIHI